MTLFKQILLIFECISFAIAILGIVWTLGKRGPSKFVDKESYQIEKNKRLQDLELKQYSKLNKMLILNVDIFILTIVFRRDKVLLITFVSFIFGILLNLIGDNI